LHCKGTNIFCNMQELFIIRHTRHHTLCVCSDELPCTL
jgi:hypothetical protein